MTSKNFLSIGSLQRRFSNGNTETLHFDLGVNVLIGSPNTGKTKWLETLDYLLGDAGSSPFEDHNDEPLSNKYDAASVELFVGEERLYVERRWKELGTKTKIFIDGEAFTPGDFQRFLLEKLLIPILHFPKGNPMSGQTWPELSFRTLLRHMYRRQRFWGDLADQQPEGDQHASLLQFLGLAKRIFNDDYGELIRLKLESERLRARRDQYEYTLKELAGDILTDPGLQLAITEAAVQQAQSQLLAQLESLRAERAELLIKARDKAFPPERSSYVERLGQQRAHLLVRLEDLRRRQGEVAERRSDMVKYRTDLVDEFERMNRAQDAGEVLADLRITHCPACDQTIDAATSIDHRCFLCHQSLPNEVVVGGLGAARLQFERERLNGELKEAEELVVLLERDTKRIAEQIDEAQELLSMVENKLAPARTAVAALAQSSLAQLTCPLANLMNDNGRLGG